MTDPTNNARIRTIAEGVTAEMIADQVVLSYDAANPTGGGISFQAREFMFLAGSYQPFSGKFDTLHAAVSDIVTRCFLPAGTLDPVTGADLGQVSVGGVGLIVKAAFDALYNEQAKAVADYEARLAEALADQEAAQAAMAEAAVQAERAAAKAAQEAAEQPPATPAPDPATEEGGASA